MKSLKFLSRLGLFLLSLGLAVSCNSTGMIGNQGSNEPIVMGYSSWPGWWPWVIAEKENLFEKNGINVDLRWFDNYTSSMEGLANGQLDANCQTLNDTISFAGDAVNGEVGVLVNDNSKGNDKIIAKKSIQKITDLKGQDVGVEVGVVDDYLLSKALEQAGMSRDDVNIVDLETEVAAQAFLSKRVDAVGAFPPFWLQALQREGSHELISSAAFPGAIPDLLVTTQTLIDNRPEAVQALVNTWFDIRDFMEKNPEQANEMMAERAGFDPEKYQRFKEGTKIFTIEENLEAFSDGSDMTHLSYAAQDMAKFLLKIDFISQKPDLDAILNDRFVEAYARQSSNN
ncbi:MAG: ABC transporter substrate-binding protein [Halothece sp.]